MFKPLPLLLALLSLLSASVHAYAAPGACTGACYAHDPTVIQRASDGLYFKFNTGGSMEIVTSPSLSGPWTIQGTVLPSGTKITTAGQTTDLWAPDVHRVGDLYHIYYTVSTFGSQNSALGLATSPSMDPGTWTDKGSIGVASSAAKSYNAIDANLLRVGSSYVLSFGSFWGGIHQVAMNAAGTKTAGSPAYQIAHQPAGAHAVEGAYVFEHDEYFYATWSEGICCGFDKEKPAAGAEYKIRVCRSASATGGFVDREGKDCRSGGGTTLLASQGTTYGPGGQGVFTDATKGLVLYYHYAKTTVGLADGQYLFGWNALSWSDGWPSV